VPLKVNGISSDLDYYTTTISRIFLSTFLEEVFAKISFNRFVYVGTFVLEKSRNLKTEKPSGFVVCDSQSQFFAVEASRRDKRRNRI
jgi:hypothetical protein